MEKIEHYCDGPLSDMVRVYSESETGFSCLLCGKTFEKGLVYRDEDCLYEASRFVRVHIEKEHGSLLNWLLDHDKRYTGLTPHQVSLLKLFNQGKSDSEVMAELGIGSAATVRNHRFALREKERQAKLFAAVMDLVKNRDKSWPAYVEPHPTATMVDDRYKITEAEKNKMIEVYFREGPDGPLSTFEMKEKAKIVVLGHITGRFDVNRVYTEKEVNEILKTAYPDFATLRRYLVEYGFMDRKKDGSRYWMAERAGGMMNESKLRKMELKAQYKEIKIEAGIFQIRNTVNNKIYLVTTSNLRTMNGTRMQLNEGVFRMNSALQRDYTSLGEGAFALEVLEILDNENKEHLTMKDALKALEEKWLEKLEPYGEKGYHKAPAKK